MSDIDWENPFTQKDFDDICTCARAERKREHLEHMSHCASYDAPEIANARFREILKAAPVVYAEKNNELVDPYTWLERDMAIDDTHSAKLVNIEELK